MTNIDDLGTYSGGYLAGATWGIAHAEAQTEERDERLARRIVALKLEHDYQGWLLESIFRTKPVNWRQRLRPDCEDNPVPHDLWPVSNPDDWTDEPTPDPT